MIRRGMGAAFILCSMSGATTASAHLTLTNPPARHPANDLKQGPCGVGTADGRTTDPEKITTYMAGETITVEWTEIIDHDPSHYRIAFSFEGDDFIDPVGFDDQETVFPELLDGIPDADAGSGHEYAVEVTLPNEPCDLCSLQVIQVMHDKPPWGPEGGDDIYYQCADIVILEDPNAPDPMDPDPMDPDPNDPLPTGDGGAPTAGTGGTPATGGAPAAGGSMISSGTGGTTADPTGTGGVSEIEGEPHSPSDDSESQPACTMSPGSGDGAPWALFLVSGAFLAHARRRLSSAR